MEALYKKLEFILTKEDIERIEFRMLDEKEVITVDLHKLKVKEAKRLIGNIIAVNRNKFTLACNHGYNHGTAIKKMICCEFENNRIEKKTGPAYNPGLTELFIKAA